MSHNTLHKFGEFAKTQESQALAAALISFGIVQFAGAFGLIAALPDPIVGAMLAVGGVVGFFPWWFVPATVVQIGLCTSLRVGGLVPERSLISELGRSWGVMA